MLKTILRGTGALSAGILPFDLDGADKVSKSSKTAQDFLLHDTANETGKDRLYLMFSLDEFGSMSKELSSIYQSSFFGLFFGALYGGITKSRVAYIDFMENNQATAFKSHYDAKKKLQDQFTMSFAKGAWRWGWRLSLFTTSYVGITTTIAVYRNKSSIVEYLAAGGITGSLYKVNMGLRGMAVGGILGGTLGGIAGLLSLLVLRLSGTSMEEVRYWQYKWRLERDKIKRETLSKEEKNELLEKHDQHHGTKIISLDLLEESTKNIESNPDKK